MFEFKVFLRDKVSLNTIGEFLRFWNKTFPQLFRFLLVLIKNTGFKCVKIDV